VVNLELTAFGQGRLRVWAFNRPEHFTLLDSRKQTRRRDNRMALTPP
jgi:hypothetical protein